MRNWELRSQNQVEITHTFLKPLDNCPLSYTCGQRMSFLCKWFLWKNGEFNIKVGLCV